MCGGRLHHIQYEAGISDKVYKMQAITKPLPTNLGNLVSNPQQRICIAFELAQLGMDVKHEVMKVCPLNLQPSKYTVVMMHSPPTIVQCPLITHTFIGGSYSNIVIQHWSPHDYKHCM